MRFKELRGKLKRGIFLSSMMDVTDGKYCFGRGDGCDMVQLGAYLAEPLKYGTERWFLPSNPEDCIKFFKRELNQLEKLDVVTCLNLATPKLEWGLEAARCFQNAGGDIVELNVHGGYQPYLSQGKLKALVLPENRAELYKWVEAFSEMNVPFIVKFRAGFIEDYNPILNRIKEYDILGVHFNIADEEKKRPDINFLHGLVKAPYLLLISGYARSREDLEKLYDAGADMVGISRPTMENASFIQQISSK